ARFVKEFSAAGELLTTYEYDADGNFVSSLELMGSYNINSSELDARLSVDQKITANRSQLSSLGINVDGNVVTGSQALDGQLVN
ncbi:MAG: hypothetical protein WC779_02220, partial [Candidatus Omnitrophota bacterium]